jgi:hypothetical protein
LLAFAAAGDSIVLATLTLTPLLPLHFRNGTVSTPLLSFAVITSQAAIVREMAAAGADVNAFFA